MADTPSLNNVSITVKRKELVAIVGEIGSGKLKEISLKFHKIQYSKKIKINYTNNN